MKAAWWVSLALAALGSSALPDDTVTIGGKTYVRKEFPAPADTAGRQRRPNLGFSDRGELIVVWDTDYDLYARRFDSQGSPLTEAAWVGSGLMADVAWVDDSTYVVAWQKRGPTCNTIGGRPMTADGVPLAAELSVSPTWYSNYEPAVAVSPTGEFLVAWHGGSGSTNVHCRRYSTITWQPIGDAFIVSPPHDKSQGWAALAIGPDNYATITWTKFFYGSAPLSDVRVQRLASDGAPAGGEMVISPQAISASNSHVAISASGLTVITWQEETEKGSTVGWDMYFRLFDASGAPVTGFQRINEVAFGNYWIPYVDMWPDGKFVVAWSAPDGNGIGCFARLFSADGSPLSGSFRVNVATQGDQMMSNVACGPNGSMAFAWYGESVDDADGAFVTLLVPEPATLSLLVVGVAAIRRRRR